MEYDLFLSMSFPPPTFLPKEHMAVELEGPRDQETKGVIMDRILHGMQWIMFHGVLYLSSNSILKGGSTIKA